MTTDRIIVPEDWDTRCRQTTTEDRRCKRDIFDGQVRLSLGVTPKEYETYEQGACSTHRRFL